MYYNIRKDKIKNLFIKGEIAPAEDKLGGPFRWLDICNVDLEMHRCERGIWYM